MLTAMPFRVEYLTLRVLHMHRWALNSPAIHAGLHSHCAQLADIATVSSRSYSVE